VVHDLDEADKVCPCGCTLEKIHDKVSEQIDYVPAQLKVIKHVQPQYTCRKCHTMTAKKKPGYMGKSMATVEFIADVIIKKYDHHLPLYRQSKILEQAGASIPDNTLCNWVMNAAKELAPLGEAQWKQLDAVDYLQADETPVKVLKPDKKGYLWGYHSCTPGNRFVCFEFALSRGGEIPNSRLANFQGLLQTDGYSGYNSQRRDSGIITLGCWDHARRKVLNAIKVANNNKTGVAGQLIKRIKNLYKIEKTIKSASNENRYQVRQAQSKPILDDIYQIFTNTNAPPKSALGVAITYLSNQWNELIRYVDYGQAHMSNCLMENHIRPFAVGRKNWMFVGNELSANRAALLYSLILSCKMNHINPKDYLVYVLKQTHLIRRKQVDPTTLLPQFIDKSLLQIA